MRISAFETERTFEEIIQERDPNVVTVPVKQSKDVGRISLTYAGEVVYVQEVAPNFPRVVDGTDCILVDV